MKKITRDMKKSYVLGAGISGLSAGYATGLDVIEAEDLPGGICSSYYIKPGEKKRLSRSPSDGEAYRFEVGGGHRLFGAGVEALDLIHRFSGTKKYIRRSSVYLSKEKTLIPYPIQNNLRFLKKESADRALKELIKGPGRAPSIMKDWLAQNFGKTLCGLFFYPFNRLYTADLYGKIAPQDPYKSPVDISLGLQGAYKKVHSVGYNAAFVYPKGGLDKFIGKIANKCHVVCKKRVIRIDTKKRIIHFQDGSAQAYRALISTLPLNRMMEMTKLKVSAKPDPYTSVLVLNIGAVRGSACPREHWLYVPHSKSGFHRVGFYSNVERSFLPRSSRKTNDRVSIYVERAYARNDKPTAKEVEIYTKLVIKELKEWGFIKDVEALDATWIDVAYTWSWPGSKWRERAIDALKKQNIYQTGRYGKWKFQGVADSILDGLRSKRYLLS